MKNSVKPSEFWTGRVMMAAVCHFMAFGASSFFIGTTYPYDPAFVFAHNLHWALSLPLVAPLTERNIGGFLTDFLGEIAPLAALMIYAANSLTVGFAVDGYLRIMGCLYRLWRARPTS